MKKLQVIVFILSIVFLVLGAVAFIPMLSYSFKVGSFSIVNIFVFFPGLLLLGISFLLKKYVH